MKTKLESATLVLVGVVAAVLAYGQNAPEPVQKQEAKAVAPSTPPQFLLSELESTQLELLKARAREWSAHKQVSDARNAELTQMRNSLLQEMQAYGQKVLKAHGSPTDVTFSLEQMMFTVTTTPATPALVPSALLPQLREAEAKATAAKAKGK